MILRSTGKCKRGIGSIRQDVNISIKNGARTEIKGFQDIKNIPHVINNELDRQLKIINSNKTVEESVRKAEPDGTTTYLRPMPGADRMYPETDIPAIEPKHIHIKKVETLQEKQERYEKKYGLNKDLSSLAVKYENKNNYNFEQEFKKYPNISPKILVEFPLIKAEEIIIKNNLKKEIFDEYKEELYAALNSKKITIDALYQALIDVNKTGKFEIEKYAQLTDKEIENTISKIISENKTAPKGLIMGKVMQTLKGRADGKKVSEIINKII